MKLCKKKSENETHYDVLYASNNSVKRSISG